MLGEIVADYMANTPIGKLLENTTLLELMEWSHKQTQKPDHPGS
jgi:hypothetical protein